MGLSPWPVGLETNPGCVRVEPGELEEGLVSGIRRAARESVSLLNMALL